MIIYNLSFVRRKWRRLELYRMVLPVRIRIYKGKKFLSEDIAEKIYPLWHRSILFLLFSEDLFNFQCLVWGHLNNRNKNEEKKHKKIFQCSQGKLGDKSTRDFCYLHDHPRALNQSNLHRRNTCDDWDDQLSERNSKKLFYISNIYRLGFDPRWDWHCLQDYSENFFFDSLR